MSDRQSYTRWFTTYPTTHIFAGQTVEVTPVVECDRLVKNSCVCHVRCGDVPEEVDDSGICKGLPR